RLLTRRACRCLRSRTCAAAAATAARRLGHVHDTGGYLVVAVVEPAQSHDILVVRAPQETTELAEAEVGLIPLGIELEQATLHIGIARRATVRLTLRVLGRTSQQREGRVEIVADGRDTLGLRRLRGWLLLFPSWSLSRLCRGRDVVARRPGRRLGTHRGLGRLRCGFLRLRCGFRGLRGRRRLSRGRSRGSLCCGLTLLAAATSTPAAPPARPLFLLFTTSG